MENACITTRLPSVSVVVSKAPAVKREHAMTLEKAEASEKTAEGEQCRFAWTLARLGELPTVGAAEEKRPRGVSGGRLADAAERTQALERERPQSQPQLPLGATRVARPVNVLWLQLPPPPHRPEPQQAGSPVCCSPQAAPGLDPEFPGGRLGREGLPPQKPAVRGRHQRTAVRLPRGHPRVLRSRRGDRNGVATQKAAAFGVPCDPQSRVLSHKMDSLHTSRPYLWSLR